MVAGILVLPVVLAFGYLYMQRKPEKLRFYFEDDLESDVGAFQLLSLTNS